MSLNWRQKGWRKKNETKEREIRQCERKKEIVMRKKERK